MPYGYTTTSRFSSVKKVVFGFLTCVQVFIFALEDRDSKNGKMSYESWVYVVYELRTLLLWHVKIYYFQMCMYLYAYMVYYVLYYVLAFNEFMLVA